MVIVVFGGDKGIVVVVVVVGIVDIRQSSLERCTYKQLSQQQPPQQQQ
jgi:hypothetical protein